MIGPFESEVRLSVHQATILSSLVDFYTEERVQQPVPVDDQLARAGLAGDQLQQKAPREEAAARLVELGAHIAALTDRGASALDIATHGGCASIVAILEQEAAHRTRPSASAATPRAERHRATSSQLYRERAQGRIANELYETFSQLSLLQWLPDASRWCVEQGAEELSDVLGQEGCAVQLVEVLQLPAITWPGTARPHDGAAERRRCGGSPTRLRQS